MSSKSAKPSVLLGGARRSALQFWVCALLMILGTVQLSNCTAIRRTELKPASPMQEPSAKEHDESKVELARRARAVLDQRCVGCHGCYDAPCQLKLTNLEGISRGGTKLLVYDGARTRATPPTRLGIDARGTRAWRAMGFHSVLGTPKDHPKARSILIRMLDLKRKHPLPAGIFLPAGMEVGINREHTCPNWDEMAEYERDHPHWGMPYALPGLSAQEDKTLRSWIDAGAPAVPAAPIPSTLQAKITAFEQWMNQPTRARKLVARYIYEHLFLASLYFDEKEKRPSHWYRLIRSSTPPGQAPQEIVTRLSIDPVNTPVHYRLVERTETVLAKTHLTYAMGPSRLRRWQELFGNVALSPGQATPVVSDARSNPFRTFEGIPIAARYKFLLDDAAFFLGGFIKGPVCRGQTALNVIQDRFWVFFVNPDSQVSTAMGNFLGEAHEDLVLPAEDGSQASLVRWVEYVARHERYLDKKEEFVEQQSRVRDGKDSPLWRGDGKNANATLTVFRHHDSATVVQGLVGDYPKTSWLLSYPELERIHYLLVAGFDVFGNIGHQVNTRLYMDFLRMEGEYNFLLLADEEERRTRAKWWYRDLGGLKQLWLSRHLDKAKVKGAWVKKGIRRLPEVYAELKRLLKDVDVGDRWNLSSDPSDLVARSLGPIKSAPASAATHFPEMALIVVKGSRSRLFTILRETAFANVARLLLDGQRRRPDEDQLTVFQGVLGSYPNAIFEVEERELPLFVEAIGKIRSETDYASLLSAYGIRRTNADFWTTSDEIHEIYAETNPLEFGRLDFNRLEGR